MFDDFTNKYKLSKTLRFRLIPQGDTLRQIETSGILQEDQLRADEAKKVKALADEYHKAFIDKTLDGLELTGLEAFETAYFAQDDSDYGKELFEECARELREQIADAFRKAPEFDVMFSGKMYDTLLPAFFADDKDALESLAFFDRFTTYFAGFNKIRILLYEGSDEKGMPKKGSVACRLVDENLPIFLLNSRNILRSAAALPEDGSARSELDVFLHGETFEEFFSPASYSHYLTQRGIDRYNQVIGGYSTEDGTKIKGINEYINMYNQKAGKGRKLPLLEGLKKMILSDRTTLSFVPEAFTGDEELVDTLKEFDASFIGPAGKIAELVKNIGDYDADGIYISTGCISKISNKVFGSWKYIDDLLSKRYDTESGLPEKRRNTKSYEKKKKKELAAVKAYSLNELDSIPGIDGRIKRYLIGAASFGALGIEVSRKGLLDRFETRQNKNTKSLRRDDHAKADIKAYMDACLDFRNFLRSFDTGSSGRDMSFYAVFDENLEIVSAATPVYNKTRNYLSGKLYTNEKIKLNFRSAEFLGGWSESVESTKLGTILLKDGRYYLGVIAKGQGDLFAKVPDAKTGDYYLKMRYNIMSGANKMLPHVFFSRKGVEKYKPSGEIMRIKESGTFKKGPDFNLEDCHKLIDYYKDCIAATENWDCFDFRFSDTSSYEDLSGFYREVEQAGYSLRYRPIDTETIDALVREGKLYLFEIWNKDFSPAAHGKPNLSTMYWKALFEPGTDADPGAFRLNGGAEVFFRKASIREEDIIRHKAGDVLRAKNPLNPRKTRDRNYDIIKDRRFTADRFLLNVPITLNANSPDFIMINDEARLAVKNAHDPHVIGVSRGENSLVYITVLNSNGDIVEKRSLDVIESTSGDLVCRTDYNDLLETRAAARDAERKSWESVESIKQLKDGYLGQVVKTLGDMMIKYDAVIAIEDMSSGFKQSRQKIEKAVYQQLEKKLINKLSFFVDKNAEPEEAGSVYRAYQLTNPFQDMKRIGTQTGFIFYVSPWLVTAVDSVTGFANFFDTRYTNMDSAREFWRSFNRITYDEKVKAFRFDFDYRNFVKNPKRLKMLEGTRMNWSVFTHGTRISEVRTDKGVKFRTVDLTGEMTELLDSCGVASEAADLREALCNVNDKAFHESMLKLFGLAVKMRNGTEVVSPVMDPETGKFFRMATDENSAYNIARKGLMLVNRIREADEEQLVSRSVKERTSLLVSGGQWLQYLQNQQDGE